MLCLILQPEGIPLFNFIDSRSVESWESYLLNMEKSGTWGTHLDPQALSNMLSVTFCLVTNSSVKEQSIVCIYPFSKRETLIDSPVLILDCEMEFHFHSLSQIQPTNLHSHEQTKQPSDQTLKCYTRSMLPPGFALILICSLPRGNQCRF